MCGYFISPPPPPPPPPINEPLKSPPRLGLSDCNGFRIPNNLVRIRTLNDLANWSND